jgi:hypothetical protein
VPGAWSLRRRTTPNHHFRTYLIALAAYAYATMHYNVGLRGRGSGNQTFETAAQDAGGGPPPAAMKQGYAPARGYQVYRNAVGDGDGEEDARGDRDPAVNAFYLNPSLAVVQVHDFGTMNLVAEGDRAKLCHLSSEREPTVHHLADGLLGPEAEVESAAGFFTSAGNPGDDSIPLAPTRDLKTGDGSGSRNLTELRCNEGRT